MMKRILTAFLCCVLCLSMMVSCNGNGDVTTATTTSSLGTTTTEPPVQEVVWNLVEDGKSDYQIVISEFATEYEIDAAYEVRLVIRQLTGVELPIVEDLEDAKDTEIVIGAKTTRNPYYESPEDDYLGGYAVLISGERVILEGGSAMGMRGAVAAFVLECLGYDINGEDIYLNDPVDTLPFIKTEFYSVEAFYELFSNIEAASIVYNGEHMQMRMAYVLRDEITKNFGTTPEMFKKSEFEGGKSIELVVDNSVESGKWKLVKPGDNCIELHAKDYYGFVGGARSLVKTFKEYEEYCPDNRIQGSYVDTLTSLERATAYAYNRQGEHRVMFYNGLWDADSTGERVRLNALLIKQYMPDVLGLQEMNKNKRGGNTTGDGGLIAELKVLGYVEAVDPRVKNFYTTSEKIPGTDASLTTDTTEHVELNGYGTGGGTKVTVNGETFYTYFNCAPLLYNTATTKLIKAEYYWYKNQWDKRTGSTHSNSASDAASKAATWGVFEDLKTGDRYIAISTHMCTRSDYIRGLQGQEMVDLIKQLVAEYDYPVILGGDYNGTYTAANYTCFEQNGLVDVEKNNLPTVYNSKTRGHHTYPALDKDKGCFQPAPDDNTGTMTSEKSVDHIMITNVEQGELDVFVFGLVIDDCSMSGADHFPMFMDFSIN